MSMNDQDNYINNSEFSLESILAEYQDEKPDEAPQRTPIEERSRTIVMEAISDTMNSARPAEPMADDAPQEENEAEPENVDDRAYDYEPDYENNPEPDYEPEEYEAESGHRFGIDLSRVPKWFSRYSHHNREKNRERTYAAADEEYVSEHAENENAPVEETEPDYDSIRREYAEYDSGDGDDSDLDYGEKPSRGDDESIGEIKERRRPRARTDDEDEEEKESFRPHITKQQLKEIFVSPVLNAAAVITAVYRSKAANRPKDEPEEEIPEVSPKKAGKLYSAQAKPLRGRALLAFVLCAILAYISYAYSTKLPLLGAMKGNVQVTALMCLVMELAVIIVGLDVFTSGVMSIIRMKPGLESLVSISCVISVLDSVIIAAKGNTEAGLPYCAISALSMAFALLGSRMFCDGMRMTMKTAVLSKNPQALTAVDNVYNEEQGIIKARTDLRGFVRRCEEPDMAEDAYRELTPIILIVAILLSAIASIKGKANFFHTLSAMTAVSASFAAFLAFPMPFSYVAKHIMSTGAAIAGCSGCMSLGQNARLVIKDSDIFPTGTLAIENIRILEGTFTDKVISYTGSLIACSESCLAQVFSDLMSRNACLTYKVENFSVHEGGGLVGLVKGEQVMVGTSGFMQLMGIRLPQKLSGSTAVFTAIGGNLVGVFNLLYKPTASVQDALVTLLQGRANPIFAVRDFNVTPMLIRQKFKMPTEGFDFPSFSNRYEISAIEPDENSEIAAVVSREGLAPMAEAAEAGRKLYIAARLCTALSLLGSAVGMLLMFFLFAAGATGSYTVANVMSFMLFWVVPVLVITYGIKK